MGLAALAAGALRFLGIGGAAAATTAARTTAGGALTGAIRAVTSPFGLGTAGGVLGGLLGGAFGGNGAAADGVVPGGVLPGSPLGQALAAGGVQLTQLSGGRFMLTAENGDVQIFNRNGMPIRPQLIIPAGQRLPGGALVVSTRQNGALIGITKRRRRRAFRTEVRRVRSTIQGCRAVLAAAEKPRRRS